MTKTIDLGQEALRGKTTQPVLRPRTNPPGVKGRLPLPFKPGEIILTDNEEKRLRAIGWSPGDPIPGNLPEKLKSALATDMQKASSNIRKEVMTTVPKGGKFNPKPTVDIDSLTPEKRAEIEQYMNEFKQLAPQIEKSLADQSKFEKLTPGAQKAILAVEQAGIEVVDSRGDKSYQRLDENPFSELQRAIDEAEGKTSSTDPGDEDKSVWDDNDHEYQVAGKRSPTGVFGPRIICPRCGCDTTETPPEISYADKSTYVIAIMGGHLFEKEYEFFGGQFKVLYKQLPTDKAELVITQIANDVRTNKMTPQEALRMGYIYRMLLSIDWVSVNGEKLDISGTVYKFVGEDEDSGEPTKLPELFTSITKKWPFSNESLWRVCRDNYSKFTELLELLEAKAADPNFWTGNVG